MHVVLCGPGPSFQHIRNGYAGAEKQDAATLERLLDSNNAMDSATDLYTLPLRPMHLLPVRSTLLVASFTVALPLWLTASDVRPMVTTSLRSVATCSAQTSRARLIAHSPRPLPDSWNPDTGATCHMTPHRQWLTHYRAHRVPVRLGCNSVVWSEGVGVCWFEPILQGSPAPLLRVIELTRR